MTLHELFNYLPRASLISVGHRLDVHMYVFVILIRNKFNVLCRKRRFLATCEILSSIIYYTYLRKYKQHKQKMHWHIVNFSHYSRPFSQQVATRFCFVYVFGSVWLFGGWVGDLLGFFSLILLFLSLYAVFWVGFLVVFFLQINKFYKYFHNVTYINFI